jgi:dipeptidyl-peptidase-4
LLSKSDLYKRHITSVESYTFNANESSILFSTDEEPIYRHSFVASYYVYEIATKKLTPISLNGKQQMASFSPVGNKVALLETIILFHSDVDRNTERQILQTVSAMRISTGCPIGYYEEEFHTEKRL